MGLLEDLATPPESTRVYCGVARAMGDMDAQTVTALRSAMSDTKWSAAAIARTLDAYGIHVNDQAINRHRRGDCRCR